MTTRSDRGGSAPLLWIGVLTLLSALAARSGAAQELLFTIPEYDLFPESIALDPVSGDYFLSSMGGSQILRVRGDGSYEAFVSAADSPFQGAGSVGMKADPVRRLLWVCTGRYFLFGGDDSAPARTGVVLLDLDDGSVIRTWFVDQPSPAHIFNDLALASDGSAYVTTTMFGKIYRLHPGSEDPELIHDAPGSHNNGITLGPNERYLFFTLDRSLRRLDLTSGEDIAISVPDEAEVGTDGLYYVDQSLVVVKPRPRQVSRLFLNETLDAGVAYRDLASDHPDFAYPTTGVVVGDSLVFLATSYANMGRDSTSARQHPAVLVHRVGLGEGGTR